MKIKLKILFRIEILLFLIIILSVLQIKINAQENSWYQTNGPYGSDVGSIVIDSTGNLFAGTTEGIYRSTDKGNHWVQFGFKDTNVTGLIINKKGQIFACYGLVSATVPVYPCHGIYRSNDGGISWQLKISGFYSPTPAISFAMTKDGILYAGTIGSGVFRSTNDGDTWTHLSFGDTTGEAACLAFASDSLFILGTEYSGLHRSTNAGTIWQKISSLNCYSLAVDAGGNIYAGTDKGIYISTDQGNNWNPSTLQVDWIHSVFIDSSGNIFAGTQNNGLYRSTDKGSSWIHMGLKVKTIFILSSNSGNELFAGTGNNGVFHSSDGGLNWIESNSGIINTTIRSFSIETNSSFIISGDNGIYRSKDYGDNYEQIAFRDTGIGFIFVDNIGRYWACSQNAAYAESHPGLFCSLDNGISWKKLLNNHTLCVAVESPQIIFAGVDSTGIYRSTDGGVIWTNNMLITGSVSSILIAVDKSILACNHTSIFRSTDEGDSWTEVLPNVGLYSGLMSMDPQGNIFAAGYGIYRSTDNGITWSWIPLTLDVRYLAINSSGNIFAGALDQGVGRSTDHGDTWTEFNNGLLPQYLTSLGVDSKDYLYAGTWGHGIFRTTKTTPVTEKTNSSIRTFSLSQNYPNPFNPSTIIRYQIPKPGLVSLKIYDILGNEVVTLVNENKEQGFYTVTFDASKLSSGVYIYQLKSNDYIASKKMVLVK